jgi:hypothetical protein
MRLAATSRSKRNRASVGYRGQGAHFYTVSFEADRADVAADVIALRRKSAALEQGARFAPANPEGIDQGRVS